MKGTKPVLRSSDALHMLFSQFFCPLFFFFSEALILLLRKDIYICMYACLFIQVFPPLTLLEPTIDW